MINATEYLGCVGVGVTTPQFFRADNGQVYVVKLQNNRLGTRVLVSEFLGAKFGLIMGLCFPPSDVISISDQTLVSNPSLNMLPICKGRHFASLYLKDAEYITPKGLKDIINIKEMAGIVLFDHLFHNSDRASNRRNLLIQKEVEGHRIFAIDNSHLFRSGRWTAESLAKLGDTIKIYYSRSYGLLLRELLSPSDFLPYLEKVEQITDHQIDCLVNEIPEEWLPDINDRHGLKTYLRLRRDKGSEIWNTLCKQIPRNRGGSRWLYSKVIGGRRRKVEQLNSK